MASLRRRDQLRAAPCPSNHLDAVNYRPVFIAGTRTSTRIRQSQLSPSQAPFPCIGESKLEGAVGHSAYQPGPSVMRVHRRRETGKSGCRSASASKQDRLPQMAVVKRQQEGDEAIATHGQLLLRMK